MKSVLEHIVGSAHFMLSEFTLGVLLLFLVVLSIVMDTNRFKAILIGFTVFVMAASFIMLFDQKMVVDRMLFMGMVRITNYVIYFKAIVLLAGILSVLMYLNEKRKFDLEPIMFIVTIVMGLNFLMSSSHFLMTYVALELVSLTSYALVYRDTKNSGETTFNVGVASKSAEASLKYLLFGAVASAVLLYGISLVYGITGTLDYGDLSTILNDGVHSSSRIMLFIAVICIVLGVLFKIGVFPMHYWIPDVYEAASTPVTAFFSIAPKVGGIVVLLILYSQIGFLSFELMATIAIITILSGNFPALWQTNLKRLLAYSSIAHSGFLMLGFVALGTSTLEAVSVYVFIYMIMNFAAFFLVQLTESTSSEATFETLSGQGKNNTLLGVFAVLLAVSLTGLPPTGGFMAKLFVLSSFWDLSATMHSNVFWIVFIVALLNTAVALFYYIKIPYFMYFKTNTNNTEIKVSASHKILLVLISILLVASFIKINWLIDFIGMFNN